MKSLYITLLLSCISSPTALPIQTATRHGSVEVREHDVYTRNLADFARLEMDAREALCHGTDDCYDRFPLTQATLREVADAYWRGDVLLTEGPFQNSGL